MRPLQIKPTGYVSKSGNLGLYKIVAKASAPDGTKRVKLESYGQNPVTFWVDESKLCDPPPPTRKENEPTQTCWECGCSFTRREALHNDGDWSEAYCGC